MAQVLELIGFEPTARSGDQLRGPCPIHRSTSRQSTSFSVNVVKHRYRCFKCGSSGGQLELWAALQGISVYQAALDLCVLAGRRELSKENMRRLSKYFNVSPAVWL